MRRASALRADGAPTVLLAALWFALLAVVFTWPLVITPATRLGALQGPGDPYLNLWILGWDLGTISRAPLDLLTGRAFDANIFHPARQTLAYSDHLLVVSLLAWPFYALTGSPVVAYNVVLVGSLIGSALAMFAFVRQVTGSTWGALAAGTLWGFWPYRFAHLGHLQLQALYAMPLAFLALHWLVAGLRWRHAWWLGLAAAFQAATSVYYGVIGAVGLGVALVALTLGTGGRRAGRLVGRVVVAGLVGTVLVAPFVWPYLQAQQREGFTRNLYEAARHAAVPGSYVSAPEVNALYGATGLLRTTRGAESELFPGFVALGLAAAGLVLARRRGSAPLGWVGLATVAVGFVLSLGPEGVRPLYAVLHSWLFGFQAIRAPARFGVLVAFGVAVLAALAVRDVERLRHGPLLAAGLVLAMVIEYAPRPLAWVPAPAVQTRVGEWLRTAPQPGAVVYLPLSIDLANTPFMVESLAHRRPIVNGYSGQRPGFFSGAVDALAAFPSVDALWMLNELGVRYIVNEAVVDTAAWPLVERARLTEPDGRVRRVYELVWSDEVAARLGEPSTPIPPEPGPVPFSVGERLVYEVFWDGPAGTVSAGTVTLDVRAPPDAVQGFTPAYTFDVTARTAPWIARFFDADDRFTTTTDASLLPGRHERRIREGRRRLDQAVTFDHAERVAQPRGPGGSPSGPAIRLWPQARDAVSALYYLRTLPLAPGGSVAIPVVENGRHSTLVVTAGGRERIPVAGRDVDALRIEARLEQRVQRRRPPEVTAWLEAAGPRRLIVAEVRAVFGNLRVQLQSPAR
jgi:hypothetical protein